MRAWLIATVILAGCLHAQAPASPRRATDPSVLAEFNRLVAVPDRIEDAAVYAAEHHLRREEIAAGAARAYAAFMRMEAYPEAAEVAWRFGFGRAVGPPAAFQRKRALERSARYIARRNEEDSGGLRLEALTELRNEALIGCFYSTRPDDGRAAVEDAVALRMTTFDDDVLFPLLTAGCPVDASWRDLIIDLAFSRGMDEYAIRHAAEADWPSNQKAHFVWGFFINQRCGAGFRAMTVMRIPPVDVVPMVETSHCEQAAISTKGWKLAVDDAQSYFFAAVRGGKYNLAWTILPFCAFDENGRIYLFQEAIRAGRGADLVKLLSFHPGCHDALMRYAFDQGRYRFVGTYAQTFEWQQKAFDKLIELHQYDFAGEVAQYGFSETLRSQGILMAFQAAMAGGDFKAGRYFVARYGPTKTNPGIVTQAMYDEEQKKRYAAVTAAAPAAAPASPRKAKRKSPQRPACPKDDWCVGDGK